MASVSHANVSQTVGSGMPPALGTTELRSFVDEIFGTPNGKPDYQIEGYNEKTHFVQSLPELLFGENKTNLGQRIIAQQLIADNFWVAVFAPFQELAWGESFEVVWDTITFHPHMPQVTPEEGRTRIGSWEYSSEQDSINRYGLGAEFHHEFLFTPQGQRIARGVLDQINTGIAESLKMGVLHAIIHAPDVALERERKNFQQNWKARHVDEWFARTKRYFGVMQREEHAVQFVSNWVREDQQPYGGESDSVVINFKMAMYVTLVNPKFTEYWRIGDSARSTLDQGPEAFGQFGDHRVYVARSFDVSRDQGPLDLLKRRVVSGEFYTMFDHIAQFYGSYEGYQSSWRSIQLMDGDNRSDQRSTITLEQAENACGIWDDNGKIVGPDSSLLEEHTYDNGDKRRNHWWYTGSDGKPRAAKFMGQILKRYFSTNSILNLARTALKSSPTTSALYSGDNAFANAIDTLQSAIQYMRSQEYDDAYHAWTLALIAQNADRASGEKHDGRVGCPASENVIDWKPNKHGGLDLPVLGDAKVQPFADGFRMHYTYPPSFHSGAQLKTLADAVSSKNQTKFEETYGFKYEDSIKVARAVETIQKAIPTLKRIFPGSVFLDPNYVGSDNHRPDEFSAFVDNILSRGAPSLWLRRPALAQASLVRAPNAAISSVTLQQAMSSVIGLSQKAADSVQNAFIGRMSTLANILQRYAPNIGPGQDSVAPDTSVKVTMIKAKLGANSARVPEDTLAFDPIQGDMVAPFSIPDEPGFKAKLPALAQSALGTLQRKNVAGVDIFTYNEGVATGVNADAYKSVVRIFANYLKEIKPTDVIGRAEAETHVKAERSRAVVLALLTMVNTEKTKKTETAEETTNQIAKRLRNVLDKVLKLAGVDDAALIDSTAAPENLDITLLKSVVERYFATEPKEAQDTFGSVVNSEGARTARSTKTISDTIDLIGRKADQSREAVIQLVESNQQSFGAAGAGAGGGYARAQTTNLPRIDSADYIRTPLRSSDVLFRSGWEYIVSGENATARVPASLPSDPHDNDRIVSLAKYREYAQVIVSGEGVLPASLAPETGSEARLGARRASHVPAALNVAHLKAKGIISSRSGYSGGASSIRGGYSSGSIENLEESLRASENYGVDRSRLVAYPSESPAASSRNSRFSDPIADMDADTPSYYRPEVRMTGIAASSASLACIAKDLDEALDTPGFQELWDELDVESQSDPVLAAIGKIYLGTPTDRRNFAALRTHNVVYPLTFLIARPLIVHHTYSAYFLLAGSRTLITRFGQPLTTWSNESQRQVYSLTITFKAKTTCVNKHNIYHAPNIFITNLERGFGVSFFTRRSFKDLGPKYTGSRDSIVAIAEPYEPYLTRKPEPTISLTGKFKFMPYNYVDDPERNERQHYYNVDFANRYWGFYDKSRQASRSEAHKMSVDPMSDVLCDWICHAGQFLAWNPTDHAFTYKRASAGFFPDNIYGPGMCTVWRDASKAYVKQDYSRMRDL